jgi:hypothetical protein
MISVHDYCRLQDQVMMALTDALKLCSTPGDVALVVTKCDVMVKGMYDFLAVVPDPSEDQKIDRLIGQALGLPADRRLPRRDFDDDLN